MHSAEGNGSYELISCSPRLETEKTAPLVKPGTARSVCFVTRNKFATLEEKDTLCIRNTENIVGNDYNIVMMTFGNNS